MGKKIIAAADLHLDSTMVGHWDAKAGMHGNWVESFARLDDVVRVCNEESADLLVIAGDLFHTGRPSAEAVAMAMERFNKLETAKVVITNGNHDQTSVVSNHRTPIDAYIGSQPFCFHAAGATEYVEHDGLLLGLVPWHRVAGSKSLNQTSDVLREGVQHLADEISDQGKPSLLFGHFTVDEATFSSGMRSSELLMSTSVLEATIPTQQLLDGPWSLARAGHIHKRQDMYIGSTYKVSFAEAEEDKGVELIDIDDDGKILEHRFIKFDVRELVKIDLTQGSDLLYNTSDLLKERDVLKLILEADQTLTKKTDKVIEDLRKRGVEVQTRRNPRERKIVINKRVAIDTDPRRAMEIYVNSHVEDPEERRKMMDAFGDVYEGAEL